MNTHRRFLMFLVASLLGLDFRSNLARGDGHPYDPETKEIFVDTLRFKLSREQVEEISAKGIVTFTSKQVKVLRRLYPSAKVRQGVITATWNDNIEGLDSDGVGCFWIHAEELAIEINDSVLSDAEKTGKALSEGNHSGRKNERE